MIEISNSRFDTMMETILRLIRRHRKPKAYHAEIRCPYCEGLLKYSFGIEVPEEDKNTINVSYDCQSWSCINRLLCKGDSVFEKAVIHFQQQKSKQVADIMKGWLE